MHPRMNLPIIGLLLVGALAACSSGSAAPTSAGGATNAGGGPQTQPAPTQNAGNGSTGGLPCKAIEADVVAAVGKTLGNGDYTGDTCDFKFGGTGDSAGMEGVVNVRRESTNSTSLSSVHLAFPGGDDLSGIGDAAYWVKSLNVLYAAGKGNTYAVQLVLFGSDANPQTMAVTIMQSLLSHL